jgi:hypothetical protein
MKHLKSITNLFQYHKRNQTVRGGADDRADDRERGFFNEEIPTNGNRLRAVMPRFFPRQNTSANLVDKRKRPARFIAPPLDKMAAKQSSSKTFQRNTSPIPVQPNVPLPQPAQPILAPLNMWNDVQPNVQFVAPLPNGVTLRRLDQNQTEDNESDNLEFNDDAGDFDFNREHHNNSDSDTEMLFYSPLPSRASSSVSRNPSLTFSRTPSIESRSPSPVMIRPPSPILIRRSPRQNKGIGPSRYGSPIPFYL